MRTARRLHRLVTRLTKAGCASTGVVVILPDNGRADLQAEDYRCPRCGDRHIVITPPKVET